MPGCREPCSWDCQTLLSIRRVIGARQRSAIPDKSGRSRCCPSTSARPPCPKPAVIPMSRSSRRCSLRGVVSSEPRSYAEQACWASWGSTVASGLYAACRLRPGGTGRPHGRAPYGYARLYDERTKVMIAQEPEPTEAPVIRELFERIDLPNGIFPEGIESGRGTSVFVGSLTDGAIGRGDLRTGSGAVLACGAPGRVSVGIPSYYR